MNRLEPRKARKKAFRTFFDTAEDRIRKIASSDKRTAELQAIYGFYVVSGGRNGGITQTLVTVFFGNRPDEEVNYVDFNQMPPQVQKKLETEAGAQLDYHLGPKGDVIVLLYPPQADRMKRNEDFILIDAIADPKALEGDRKLKCHWRILLAYMECSCLDGAPTLWDRIIVRYILFTKHVFEKGRQQEKLWIIWIGWIFKWAMMVGLSGVFIRLFDLLFIASK